MAAPSPIDSAKLVRAIQDIKSVRPIDPAAHRKSLHRPLSAGATPRSRRRLDAALQAATLTSPALDGVGSPQSLPWATPQSFEQSQKTAALAPGHPLTPRRLSAPQQAVVYGTNPPQVKLLRQQNIVLQHAFNDTRAQLVSALQELRATAKAKRELAAEKERLTSKLEAAEKAMQALLAAVRIKEAEVEATRAVLGTEVHECEELVAAAAALHSFAPQPSANEQASPRMDAAMSGSSASVSVAGDASTSLDPRSVAAAMRLIASAVGVSTSSLHLPHSSSVHSSRRKESAVDASTQASLDTPELMASANGPSRRPSQPEIGTAGGSLNARLTRPLSRRPSQAEIQAILRSVSSHSRPDVLGPVRSLSSHSADGSGEEMAEDAWHEEVDYVRQVAAALCDEIFDEVRAAFGGADDNAVPSQRAAAQVAEHAVSNVKSRFAGPEAEAPVEKPSAPMPPHEEATHLVDAAPGSAASVASSASDEVKEALIGDSNRDPASLSSADEEPEADPEAEPQEPQASVPSSENVLEDAAEAGEVPGDVDAIPGDSNGDPASLSSADVEPKTEPQGPRASLPSSENELEDAAEAGEVPGDVDAIPRLAARVAGAAIENVKRNLLQERRRESRAASSPARTVSEAIGLDSVSASSAANSEASPLFDPALASSLQDSVPGADSTPSVDTG